MGNRAVITFDKALKPEQFGIYLHWNGGRDSVQAFCDATRELMKERGADSCYAPARMIQAIGNFMGGVHSLGIGALSTLDTDNGDNGVYVVDPESLKIIARRFSRGSRGEQKDKEKYSGVLAATLEINRPIFDREKLEQAKAA